MQISLNEQIFMNGYEKDIMMHDKKFFRRLFSSILFHFILFYISICLDFNQVLMLISNFNLNLILI